MSLDTKVKEQLSAYLDNELSENEKQLLEKELQNSPTLREELGRLSAVKNAISSIQPVQEDTYFETRLLQRIHAGEKEAKSWKFTRPAFVLSAITLACMALFKLQPGLFSDFLNSRQNDIQDLYAANFKPLVYATSLTNDDILNFAVHKAIPLNREEKQFLSLGFGRKGEQILEVIPAGVTAPEMRSEVMADNLQLTPGERAGLDRILKKYNDKIASAVLVNEKNTVAVNQALWNYHSSLRGELLEFVSQTSNPVLRELFPREECTDLVVINRKIADASPSNRFYCISPDTIFLAPLNIDKAKILAEISSQRSVPVEGISPEKRVRIHFDEHSRLLADEGITSNGMRVLNDAQSCRIIISPLPDAPLTDPDLAHLPRKMDSMFTQIQYFAYFDGSSLKEKREIRVQIDGQPQRGKYAQASKGFIADSNRGNVRLELKDTFPRMESWGRSIPPEKMLDSLSHLFRQYFDDSTAVRYPRDLRRGMEEFRQEFDRMKKEFEQFRENLKGKDTQKKIIEIQYHYDI